MDKYYFVTFKHPTTAKPLLHKKAPFEQCVVVTDELAAQASQAFPFEVAAYANSGFLEARSFPADPKLLPVNRTPQNGAQAFPRIGKYEDTVMGSEVWVPYDDYGEVWCPGKIVGSPEGILAEVDGSETLLPYEAPAATVLRPSALVGGARVSESGALWVGCKYLGKGIVTNPAPLFQAIPADTYAGETLLVRLSSDWRQARLPL